MTIKRILWAVVFVGFVAAFISGLHRRRTESENQSVEIALDYAELRTLSGATGTPLPDVLRKFKQAGAISVAVQEETIGSLEDSRRLIVQTNREQQTLLSLPPIGDAEDSQEGVADGSDAVLARVASALRAKTRYSLQVSSANEVNPVLRINAPFNLVRGVGVGLDPDATSEIKAAGLRVIGRVNNYTNVQPNGIAAVVGALKKAGASTVLFSGDDVLGFKGHITRDKKAEGLPAITTEDALRGNGFNGLTYATVEFGKQKGDAELVKALPERTVRLHTVLGTEMANADIPGNVQRFLLAARERNIRVLFVRLFLSEADPLETNVDYVQKIATGLDRAHLVRGAAHGYGALSTPIYLRFFIGLGLASAFLLLLDSITGFFSGVGLGGRLSVALLRLVAWAGAILLFALPILPVGGFKGVQLAALACTFVFPPLGLLHADKLRPDYRARSPIALALLRFAQTTGITLIGAAYIVGMLADRLFLIKAESFVGVKVSEIVPVLIIAIIYGLRLRASGRRPWEKAIGEARETVTNFLREPLIWWQVAVALLVLIVLAFLVMRSGNDPGIGVSGVELKLRSLLDARLPARPRFKEFLIHPFLLIGFALAVRGRRKWALPLILAGAIGQADLLNTFCHLHTALPASMTRAGLGIVLGLGIGLAAYAILKVFVLPRLPDTAPNDPIEAAP